MTYLEPLQSFWKHFAEIIDMLSVDFKASREQCLLSRADRKSQVRQCLGFVQLIFYSLWSMNQLNQNPNIAKLETSLTDIIRVVGTVPSSLLLKVVS